MIPLRLVHWLLLGGGLRCGLDVCAGGKWLLQAHQVEGVFNQVAFDLEI